MSNREVKMIHEAQHPREVLDVALIRSLFENSDVHYCFTEGGGKLALTMHGGGEYILGRITDTKRAVVRHMTLTYLEPSGEENNYYTNHSQYFSPDDSEGACQALVDRVKAPAPMYGVPSSCKKLEELYRQQSGDLFYESHYDYLHAMLNLFWMEVFGKTADETGCGGMVGAHGDKAYSSRSEWKEHGIPFQHGVLLFLLMYTDERGETPKHKSHEWVIENYPKYFHRIISAENKLLRSIGFKGDLPLEIYRRDEYDGEYMMGCCLTFHENGVFVKRIVTDSDEAEAIAEWLKFKKQTNVT